MSLPVTSEAKPIDSISLASGPQVAAAGAETVLRRFRTRNGQENYLTAYAIYGDPAGSGFLTFLFYVGDNPIPFRLQRRTTQYGTIGNLQASVVHPAEWLAPGVDCRISVVNSDAVNPYNAECDGSVDVYDRQI